MKVNVKLQRMYVGTNKGFGHINGSRKRSAIYHGEHEVPAT